MLHRAASPLALAALISLTGPGAAQAPAPPARVASINLCTDQLLLDLAEPERIVGLSPFARDAARSWAATAAASLPVLSGTAEEIVWLRPDLVLAGRFTKRTTRELIRAQGIPLAEFDAVRSISEAKAQILDAAERLGRPDRGRERVEAIDAALARLRAASPGPGLRVLPLSRRGWSSGRDSLAADLLREAGLGHALATEGPSAGGFLPLETVIRLKPDALLVSSESGRAEDQGRALLQHPALERLVPPERRIVVPEALTVCGGPMLVEAMDRLAAQLRRLEALRAP